MSFHPDRGVSMNGWKKAKTASVITLVHVNCETSAMSLCTRTHNALSCQGPARGSL